VRESQLESDQPTVPLRLRAQKTHSPESRPCKTVSSDDSSTFDVDVMSVMVVRLLRAADCRRQLGGLCAVTKETTSEGTL